MCLQHHHTTIFIWLITGFNFARCLFTVSLPHFIARVGRVTHPCPARNVPKVGSLQKFLAPLSPHRTDSGPDHTQRQWLLHAALPLTSLPSWLTAFLHLEQALLSMTISRRAVSWAGRRTEDGTQDLKIWGPWYALVSRAQPGPHCPALGPPPVPETRGSNAVS